ncbi:hypothetical protein, partial [Streptomyces diastaticus]
MGGQYVLGAPVLCPVADDGESGGVDEQGGAGVAAEFAVHAERAGLCAEDGAAARVGLPEFLPVDEVGIERLEQFVTGL